MFLKVQRQFSNSNNIAKNSSVQMKKKRKEKNCTYKDGS